MNSARIPRLLRHRSSMTSSRGWKQDVNEVPSASSSSGSRWSPTRPAISPLSQVWQTPSGTTTSPGHHRPQRVRASSERWIPGNDEATAANETSGPVPKSCRAVRWEDRAPAAPGVLDAPRPKISACTWLLQRPRQRDLPQILQEYDGPHRSKSASRGTPISLSTVTVRSPGASKSRPG